MGSNPAAPIEKRDILRCVSFFFLQNFFLTHFPFGNTLIVSLIARQESVILDTDYAVEDYAICFSKDNTELQKKVNEALNELKKDGTVQKIVDKYIKAD